MLKNNTLHNDNFVSEDLQEQTEKLVSLLLHNTENCWRKDKAWVHFVPNQ